MELLNTFNDDLVSGKTPAQTLREIWKNHFGSEVEKAVVPLLQEKIKKGVVTFLSINPSLPPEDAKKAKKGYEPERCAMIDCLPEKKLITHRHYWKFFEIGNYLKCDWAAIELLYNRDSTQNNVEALSSDFQKEQMKLTFEILEAIQPKVIVVANKGASNLFHKYQKELQLKIVKPEEKNKFIYRINNIPFIVRESQYLGSRIHWQLRLDLREKMFIELERVLNIIS